MFVIFYTRIQKGFAMAKSSLKLTIDQFKIIVPPYVFQKGEFDPDEKIATSIGKRLYIENKIKEGDEPFNKTSRRVSIPKGTEELRSLARYYALPLIQSNGEIDSKSAVDYFDNLKENFGTPGKNEFVLLKEEILRFLIEDFKGGSMEKKKAQVVTKKSLEKKSEIKPLPKKKREYEREESKSKSPKDVPESDPKILRKKYEDEVTNLKNAIKKIKNKEIIIATEKKLEMIIGKTKYSDLKLKKYKKYKRDDTKTKPGIETLNRDYGNRINHLMYVLHLFITNDSSFNDEVEKID